MRTGLYIAHRQDSAVFAIRRMLGAEEPIEEGWQLRVGPTGNAKHAVEVIDEGQVADQHVNTYSINSESVANLSPP